MSDVEPVDVDVLGNLIRYTRNLTTQIIDIAVVAPSIEPDIIGHQAFYAIRQTILSLDLSGVVQAKDVPGLVTKPATPLINEDAKCGTPRSKFPEYGSLSGC